MYILFLVIVCQVEKANIPYFMSIADAMFTEIRLMISV